MKNTYKIALVLFSISTLVACFCKKEKCLKLTESEKNPLGYLNGQSLKFINFYEIDNRFDSSIIEVSQKYSEGNNPSGVPEDKNPCACYKNVNVDFKAKEIGIYENSYNYYLLSYLKNSETKDEITYTNYLFKDFFAEKKFNKKTYNNVFYDSIIYNKNQSIVKIYNKTDGLLAYRFYEISNNKLIVSGEVFKINK